jgi:hypothetical protein
MHNRKWVRRGFGSVALLAAGAGTWGLACSSNDNNPNLTGLDSGAGTSDTGAGSVDTGASATDGTTGSDSGGSLADSAADTGSMDAGVPPLISLVHAAPDVPPVRFCFGLSPAGALGGTEAKPLLSSGLPFGAGGALAIAPSNAAIISTVDIYIWAVPASSINAANAASFADAGDAGQDYGACSVAVNLPGSILFAMIPRGTVQYNHSYIVAMDGCQNPGIDDMRTGHHGRRHHGVSVGHGARQSAPRDHRGRQHHGGACRRDRRAVPPLVTEPPGDPPHRRHRRHHLAG